jgi:sugar lactone lactonase YvrE
MNEQSQTAQPIVMKCPECRAPVDLTQAVANGERSVRCQYCGTSVPVPDALRVRPPVVAKVPSAARPGLGAGCVILILLVVGFIVLMTVVPILLAKQGLDMGAQVVSTAMAAQTDARAAIQATRTARPAPTAAPSPTPGLATIVTTFGSKGTGQGQFDNARSIGVDGTGNIYVGEYSGGRVQVFDAQGKFVTQWFAGNSKTLMLGFAVDRNGTVFVADGQNITRFEGATGNNLGKLKYNRPGGPRFGELAITPDGGLLAMWYERREGIFTSLDGAREDLVRFDRSGAVTMVISGAISSQTDQVQLHNVLVADGQGNIYVLSSYAGAIFRFTREGKFVTRLASGQLGSVGAFAIHNDGRIFVGGSDGIQISTSDGRSVGRIATHGSVSGLAFGPQGNLVVLGGLDTVSVMQLQDR